MASSVGDGPWGKNLWNTVKEVVMASADALAKEGRIVGKKQASRRLSSSRLATECGNAPSQAGPLFSHAPFVQILARQPLSIRSTVLPAGTPDGVADL